MFPLPRGTSVEWADLVVVPSALMPVLLAEQTTAIRLRLSSWQMMLMASLGNLPMEVPPYFCTSQLLSGLMALLSDSMSTQEKRRKY